MGQEGGLCLTPLSLSWAFRDFIAMLLEPHLSLSPLVPPIQESERGPVSQPPGQRDDDVPHEGEACSELLSSSGSLGPCSPPVSSLPPNSSGAQDQPGFSDRPLLNKKKDPEQCLASCSPAFLQGSLFQAVSGAAPRLAAGPSPGKNLVQQGVPHIRE